MPAVAVNGARLRLALIRQRYNPFGGAERFIERAIAALERDAVDVTLITRAWRAETGRRVLIVNPPFLGGLWRDASFSRAAQAKLRREGFDLAQSHERIPGCDIYRAGDGVHRKWLDYRATGASLTERLGVWLNPYHWYICAVERAMFEHSALRAVICNSKMVAAEIGHYFNISADKLHVIYNGVDLVHFHPDHRAALRDAARSGFRCGPDDTLFAFVGSGFARKGLSSAIEALASTGRADLRLVVAGHDRSATRYERQARRAGVGEQVMFLGGLEDVRSVYAAADCFILPTRYDPFPNTALEALAMGLPIIVSDQCGAAEVVRPGVNGWICKPDRPEEIAGLLIEASQKAGAALSAQARKSVEQFGVEVMADRMIDLYSKLLGRVLPQASPRS